MPRSRLVRVDGPALARLLQWLVQKAQHAGDPIPPDTSDQLAAMRDASAAGGDEGLTIPQLKRLLQGVPSLPETQADTAISQIMYYLVRKYREPLGLGDAIEDAIAVISDRTRDNAGRVISAANIAKLFDGTTVHPHEPTCERLHHAFSPVWPQLRPEWFRERTWEAFKRAARIGDDAAGKLNGNGRTRIATYHEDEDTLRSALCGVYVCYRYAFQSDLSPGDVSREVLHVWLEDGVLHWRMSFDRFKQIKMMPAFEGEVLPMGRTLLLVGAHQDPLHKVVRADGREAPLVERGRSLALFEDTHRTNLKDVRFGLLTSTMSAAPYLPCTACVVLVKVPGVDANDRAKVDEVIRTVTKIESWEKIVLEDFKTEDPDDPIWISAFLDNRVAGSITAPRGKKNGSLQEEIDRKLAEWQRPRMDERRDQTLKIDIQRFYERMPKIVDRVRKHAGNAAPFK